MIWRATDTMPSAAGENVEPAPAACDHEQQQDNTTHIRPQAPTRRKSSFSDALNRASKPFARRRTATLLQQSSTTATSTDNNLNRHQSRLPTPSGVPKNVSGSFFNTSALKPVATCTATEVNNLTIPKRGRNISARLARTPFFSHQNSANTTPASRKHQRETSTQIETRGLMAPLQPPLPKSSTMGNLSQGTNAQSSPRTPSFMRSTSSSAARRATSSTPKPQYNTTLPTISACPTPSYQPRMSLERLSAGSAIPRRPSFSTHSNPIPQRTTSRNVDHQHSGDQHIPSGQHPPRKSSLAHAHSRSSINVSYNTATRKRSTSVLRKAESDLTIDGIAQTSQLPNSKSGYEGSIGLALNDQQVNQSSDAMHRSNYSRRGQSLGPQPLQNRLSSHEEREEPNTKDTPARSPSPDSSDPRLVSKFSLAIMLVCLMSSLT